MSEEETKESVPTGNSEGLDTDPVDVPADGTDPQDSGQSATRPSDPRFESVEELEKSYKNLESKLGNFSETSARAQRWDDAVKALAVDRDISESEAEDILRKDVEKRLTDNAPKIQQRQENEQVQQLQRRLDRRELIDEYPEAQAVLDRIEKIADATGEPLTKIYESTFKDLTRSMDNQPKPSGPTYPQVRRDSDDDAPPSRNRALEAAEERVKNAKSPAELEEAVREKFKVRRFGG